jgi:formylglycine-generating enzyme required for sulfatase activity
MTLAPINPALQFIQAAGFSGFFSGVQTGMIPPPQALTGFKAVGAAIDTYAQKTPGDDNTRLIKLSKIITGLPQQYEDFSPKVQLDLVVLYCKELGSSEVGLIDRAVRLAASIDAIGQAALAGAAAMADMKPPAVEDVKPPFDLDAEWRWIPPGRFQMGSRDDDPYAEACEKPLRTLMISGFYMLDHPATNAEFLAFLKAMGRKDQRRSHRSFNGDNQPAICITFGLAVECSEWLGEELSRRTGFSLVGRPPTEAEWEKAAKGPSGNEFVIPATHEQAHFDAEETRAVNHPDVYKNGFGLGDMLGNVHEWASSSRESRSSKIAACGNSWSERHSERMRAAFRYAPVRFWCLESSVANPSPARPRIL